MIGEASGYTQCFAAIGLTNSWVSSNFNPMLVWKSQRCYIDWWGGDKGGIALGSIIWATPYNGSDSNSSFDFDLDLLVASSG